MKLTRVEMRAKIEEALRALAPGSYINPCQSYFLSITTSSSTVARSR